jgi:uncharacterized protein (TIGR02646 family)
MILGPGRLMPLHRYILKKGVNRKTFSLFQRGKLEWGSKEFKEVKRLLRQSLRLQQDGRCVFCRRRILIERRNAGEDIEHFLDKSRLHYRRWVFSPNNISIACRPCNFVKSTRDLGNDAVRSATAYSSDMGQFSWLHPYYENYHENIEIKRGWIYEIRATAPNIAGAQSMIHDLELASLPAMHSYANVIKDKIYRLTLLASRAFKNGNSTRGIKLLDVSLKYQKETWPDF